MKKYIIILLLAPMAWSAPKKPQLPPVFDPDDQVFRMAPMPQSSRSIAVSLGGNIHLAFDTVHCRIHSVWKGGPLKLYGPAYHGGKRPFICQPNGKRLWGNPPLTPWEYANPDLKSSDRTKPCKARYVGHSTKGGFVSFIYDLLIPKNKAIRVNLTVYFYDNAVVRRYDVAPRTNNLYLLAHTEKDLKAGIAVGNGFNILRGKERFHVSYYDSQHKVSMFNYTDLRSFRVETVTEQGTITGNSFQLVKDKFLHTDFEFPKGDSPITVHVGSMAKPEWVFSLKGAVENPADFLYGKRESKSDPVKASSRARRSFVLSPYYKTEAFALPEKMNLLVTGMDWLAKDKLAVCTYAGEVWIVEDATGPVGQMKFRRFARGMNEPMGVLVKDGKIHLGNKAEITRLSDTDKDGAADLFECVNRDWDYTGSYNAFSYGPVLDKNGNFVVANAGHAGRWSAQHMGWALRIKPGSAKAEAFASGFREPNGIGTFGPDKDIFVTDNQGAWIGACKLNHVKDGGFYGHPASKPAPEELYAGRKALTPPAVWFPYKLARSSSGMCEIKDDRFGPFKGQLLVGDFQNAIVTRVQLEKVGGEWQGAVWPFLKGFQSGVNRLVMGPDGHLYVGGCKTVAWAANAPFSQGLERVKFSGKIPFEVQTVRAMPDGFELTFTKPVGPKAAGDVAGYDVWQYSRRQEGQLHGHRCEERHGVKGWAQGTVAARGLESGLCDRRARLGCPQCHGRKTVA